MSTCLCRPLTHLIHGYTVREPDKRRLSISGDRSPVPWDGRRSIDSRQLRTPLGTYSKPLKSLTRTICPPTSQIRFSQTLKIDCAHCNPLGSNSQRPRAGLAGDFKELLIPPLLSLSPFHSPELAGLHTMEKPAVLIVGGLGMCLLVSPSRSD
jgi:hypothetical protein